MFAKKLVVIAACVALSLGSAAAHQNKVRISVHKIDCPGGSPMSVEGANGVYCVYGSPCSGQNYSGACPAPQPGLESGAFCESVNGVAGCKKHSAHKHRHKQFEEDSSDSNSEEGSAKKKNRLRGHRHQKFLNDWPESMPDRAEMSEPMLNGGDDTRAYKKSSAVEEDTDSSEDSYDDSSVQQNKYKQFDDGTADAPFGAPGLPFKKHKQEDDDDDDLSDSLDSYDDERRN